MKVISEKLLGGTMYAPFCRTLDPNQKEWDKDFENMAKMGYTCVHGFAEWHDIEYEKGKFDFSRIDYMLDCAKKYGIKAIVNVATQNNISFYAPRWLMNELKDGNVKDAFGNQLNDGLYTINCLDNPTYLKYGERYLRAVGKHFAGDDRVAGYVLWGEPFLWSHTGHQICYCEHTVARFREWLKKKYKTIEKLNELWDSEGPSDFPDFESVIPPRGATRRLGGYVSWDDWRSFMADNFCARIKWADDILKEEGATQPTIVETDANLGPHATDQWELAKCADILGLSSFQAPGRATAFVSWVGDSIAKNLNKSTFVVEAYGGNTIFRKDAHTPSDLEVQSNFIQRIANGYKGVMYWCYRPRMSDVEGGEWGMCLRDGTPTTRAYAGGEIIRQVKKYSDIITKMQRKSSVAIYTGCADITELDEMTGELIAARRGSMYMLNDLHVNGDFINEEHIVNLRKYKVLILPVAYILSEKTIQEIVKFVENGGVVISDYLVGVKRKNGICYYGLQETGLDKAFGLIDMDTYIANPYDLAESEKFDLANGDRFSKPYVKGAETYATYGDKIMITKNDFGKGKAYFIGHSLFANYARRMSKKSRETVWGILQKSGVNAYMDMTNAKNLNQTPLISSCIESEKSALYTVYNETAYPVEDTVILPKGEYTDFSDKKYVGEICADGVRFEIKLKPKETAVFLKRS